MVNLDHLIMRCILNFENIFFWDVEHFYCLPDVPMIILDRRQIIHGCLALIVSFIWDDKSDFVFFFEGLLFLVLIWLADFCLQFFKIATMFIQEADDILFLFFAFLFLLLSFFFDPSLLVFHSFEVFFCLLYADMLHLDSSLFEHFFSYPLEWK